VKKTWKNKNPEKPDEGLRAEDKARELSAAKG